MPIVVDKSIPTTVFASNRRHNHLYSESDCILEYTSLTKNVGTPWAKDFMLYDSHLGTEFLLEGGG
jgi:hypothetical protein